MDIYYIPLFLIAAGIIVVCAWRGTLVGVFTAIVCTLIGALLALLDYYLALIGGPL